MPDIETISFEALIEELTGMTYAEFNKSFEEDLEDDKARNLGRPA